MEIMSVPMETPEGANLIIGQTHFIKSVEDLYEAVISSVPGVRFGLAFNEASGPCLVRAESNDEGLRQAAIRNAQAIGSGHVFVVVVQNAFPINLLRAIREVPEVCSIFCATANPVEVIVTQGSQGRGVLGVIDGLSPKGVETASDVAARKEMLRNFGYKL
ncbi:MAG: adenosine-specific kinase [Acidobacteria bacterium]|nr:adenosine-specific kinase [Acidobacteriota bacterium]